MGGGGSGESLPIIFTVLNENKNKRLWERPGMVPDGEKRDTMRSVVYYVLLMYAYVVV